MRLHYKSTTFTNHETFSRALITAIEWTVSTDKEVGLLTEDEGIELGFDSDHEDENINKSIGNESESDVSDVSDSDYSSSSSEIEHLSCSSNDNQNGLRQPRR